MATFNLKDDGRDCYRFSCVTYELEDIYFQVRRQRILSRANGIKILHFVTVTIKEKKIEEKLTTQLFTSHTSRVCEKKKEFKSK